MEEPEPTPEQKIAALGTLAALMSLLLIVLYIVSGVFYGIWKLTGALYEYLLSF